MAGPSLLVRQTLRRHGLPARPHLFQHGHLDVLPRTTSKPEAFRYSALRRSPRALPGSEPIDCDRSLPRELARCSPDRRAGDWSRASSS
jgi:hypothetical protein